MSRITAHVPARAMAEFPEAENELAAGDRVAFTSRHDYTTRAGILLAVHHWGGTNHASVLIDAEPGYTNTVWHLNPAALTAFASSPDHHRDALLRAADWFRHHPNNHRPEKVTTNVDPAAAAALAELVAVLRTPPHVLHDQLDARYSVTTEGGAL